MGMHDATLTAHASLSNHNSNQDAEDATTWAAFVAEVRQVAERPEYARIVWDVSADDVSHKLVYANPDEEP